MDETNPPCSQKYSRYIQHRSFPHRKWRGIIYFGTFCRNFLRKLYAVAGPATQLHACKFYILPHTHVETNCVLSSFRLSFKRREGSKKKKEKEKEKEKEQQNQLTADGNGQVGRSGVKLNSTTKTQVREGISF